LFLNEETTKEPHTQTTRLISISLGRSAKSVAYGLFSTLRQLDEQGADMIYVEGVLESGEFEEGDIAEAVMNRLRKAATTIVKS